MMYIRTPPLSNNRTSRSLGSERTERGRPGTGASARIWYRNPYLHTSLFRYEISLFGYEIRAISLSGYEIRALISVRNKLIWVRNKGPYFGTK